MYVYMNDHLLLPLPPSTPAESSLHPSTHNTQGWTLHPYEKNVDWDFVHPQFKVRDCSSFLLPPPPAPLPM